MSKQYHNHKAPPRWADKLLEWFCAPLLLEEVQGDLHERFYKSVEEVGEKRAQWEYVLTVLGFIRPFVFKGKKNQQTELLVIDMLNHYLTIAFRHLSRGKAFSFINIVGLALGITCSLLIALWVRDEIRIDNFHTNGSQLYRVITRGYLGDGKVQAYPYTQGLLYEELKKKIPEVQHACGFSWETKTVLTVDDQMHMEEGRFATADFFQMFSFPLVKGDPSIALNSPVSITISQHLAEKYFGSAEEAMGKTIRVDNRKDFQVSGVFANTPSYSSLQFDYVLPWSDFVEVNPWLKDWQNTEPHTYVQLHPQSDAAQVNAKLKHFLDGYKLPLKNELFLQRFDQAYLYSNFTNGEQDGGRIEYVRIFSFVALFIILIACINFMNLATARSAKRAKEVGVRKTMGAVRSVLITQFMGEAFLLTGLATLLALLFTFLLLPGFNELTGKQITIKQFNLDSGLYLVLFILCTGLLAGSYPALFLSSFNPIRVLKGTLTFKPRVKLFWQSLVVIQFVLTTLIIIGTLVTYQQLAYAQSKNLGYDRENLIYVPMEGELAAKYAVFKEGLLQTTGVQAITRMGQTPTTMSNSTLSVWWPKKDPTIEVNFMQVPVGYDFLKTLNIKLLKGREFSPAFADSSSYLVNETAIKMMGKQDDPLGQKVTFLGKTGQIIGVIQDFHLKSLHEQIPPLLVHLDEYNAYWGNVLVRTAPCKTKEVLSNMEQLHKQLNPKVPFTYRFSTEAYNKLYKSEQTVSTLSGYLATFAIFISCLGLLGLITSIAERRTKEIGIRKVLGASVANISFLLSKNLLKLVLIAFIIATPVSWYFMNRWLENFAYRIPIEWWIFLLAGLLVLLVALLTISFQSVKAALINPVKSLRNE